MKITVGTDIVVISRIARLKKERIFTQSELSDGPCTEQRLAACFAAKEAFVKAVKTGFGPIGPLDVWVAHTAEGAPYLMLSDKARALFGHMQFDLSISHDGGFAVATVVAVTPPQAGA